MQINLKPLNIIESFKLLKGNTRTSVIFEPMWGIPFVFYNFYLSLYMINQGVSDRQLGYLISIGCVFSAIFSLFGGVITDCLGRKRTTLIFDFISWPASIMVYIISNNFWLFAVGMILGSTLKIVSVSWTLMVVEDADTKERVAAFNIINIINIATGILTPIAGLLVGVLGITKAERIFMVFAVISMTAMMIWRNHFYSETKTGKQIMDMHGKVRLSSIFKRGLYSDTFKVLKGKPKTIMIMCVVILYNIYIPIGAFSSLYFAPYLIEVLKLNKSTISVLGGVYSAATLFVLLFINPAISKFNMVTNLIIGLTIQTFSLFLLIIIPQNSFALVIVYIAIFAIGFGVFKPFMDSMLAEVTECSQRAGIYSLINTITSVSTVFIGFASGYLYVMNPKLIYVVSITILIVAIVILVFTNKYYSVKNLYKE